MTLWAGLIGGPWFIVLGPLSGESGYMTLSGSCFLIALLAWRQLATNRPRPGLIATAAATLMVLQLPFFPEAEAVAQTIPFGVAGFGVIASPFVRKRAFPFYAAYMGAMYMTQLYWTPVRVNTVVSLGFEVALFTLISVALRFISGASEKNNLRYRHLFERVPTSIWLEDFSEVAAVMNDWKRAGVRDVEAFLAENPVEFDRAISKIRVTDVNPATVRLINAADRSSVLGTLDPRTIIEDTRTSFTAVLAAIWNDQDTVKADVVGTTIDGRPLEAVLRMLAPRDEMGRLQLEDVVVSMADVTDLKATQRQLERAKTAAEAASITKSEFLANMSHEIRTPMNAILGMTELALVTGMTPEQREYLGMTKSSVDALLTLVNDILDFSKIEAGKMQLDNVAFSVRDSVGDTIRTLAVKAAEKGLALTHEIVGDIPEGLQGDPGRLRQILINLVGNALKFTHVGGVAVAVTADDIGSDETMLHFSVADTGIGIPGDQQEAIFDTFAQADGSTTRRYGGTGLGLSITAQLVEMMGGRTWVESEVGAGSTFHFTARFGIVDDSTVSVATTDLSRTKVLTVADRSRQRALVEMLRQGGMHPISVHSAADALELLDDLNETEQPDLIVAEVDNSSGVSSRLIDAGLPIIMLADLGRRGDAGRFHKMGVAAYLTNPVSHSDLLDTIRTAVAGTAGGALITRHWLREHRKRFRVLVADDSPTNRMLAKRLLENGGHEVTSVDDGSQAVEALESNRFDVVLMDVQMPVMDGFEATAEIRQRESGTGEHIPIIALTAHAMDGDRQRCLDAGMDAYVSKPFRSAELFATIEQLVVVAGEGPRVAIIDHDDYEDSGPAIDRRELMESVGGMPDLLREIVNLVIEEIPPIAAEIPPAIDSADLEVVARRAHRIKGSVGSVAARRAYLAASNLEQCADAEDFAAVAVAWDTLSRELKFMDAELDELLAPPVLYE
ncbi:MAG: response regulator [Acidimicrobiia bacterium]